MMFGRGITLLDSQFYYDMDIPQGRQLTLLKSRLQLPQSEQVWHSGLL